MAQRLKKSARTSTSRPRGWLKRRSPGPQEEPARSLRRRAVSLALTVALLLAVVVGFAFLQDYVRRVARARGVKLRVELVDPPPWAGPALCRDICLASGVYRNDFILDEHLPARWAANLARCPWVKRVRRVRRLYDGRVQLDLELRRPLASIRQGGETFYVDAAGIVLPPARLVGSQGHVVELRGEVAALPPPGRAIRSAALLAGLQVLLLIRQVDEALPADQRLWHELAVLDVGNYDGRRDAAAPHLTLYTLNRTEVRWGAAVGRTRPWHEASEKTKLATLYRAHRRTGTLDRYQFIELRDAPKDSADPLRPRNG